MQKCMHPDLRITSSCPRWKFRAPRRPLHDGIVARAGNENLLPVRGTLPRNCRRGTRMRQQQLSGRHSKRCDVERDTFPWLRPCWTTVPRLRCGGRWGRWHCFSLAWEPIRSTWTSSRTATTHISTRCQVRAQMVRSDTVTIGAVRTSTSSAMTTVAATHGMHLGPLVAICSPSPRICRWRL